MMSDAKYIVVPPDQLVMPWDRAIMSRLSRSVVFDTPRQIDGTVALFHPQVHNTEVGWKLITEMADNYVKWSQHIVWLAQDKNRWVYMLVIEPDYVRHQLEYLASIEFVAAGDPKWTIILAS